MEDRTGRRRLPPEEQEGGSIRRVGGVGQANGRCQTQGRPRAGLLHLVSDPAAAATWNVEALPGFLYLIQERQTGKCLESRVSGDTHVARLAPLKSDDPRQQWRFEPAPAADSTNATNDGASSWPMPQTATSPEPPRTNATASKASDSSRKEALTAAQKEQIRLRLQAALRRVVLASEFRAG